MTDEVVAADDVPETYFCSSERAMCCGPGRLDLESPRVLSNPGVTLLFQYQQTSVRMSSLAWLSHVHMTLLVAWFG
jgi:hypothetical protein